MRRAAELYLAIFLFGYYMSYPAKVLLASTQAPTLLASTLLGWSVFVFYILKGMLSARFSPIGKRQFFIIIALIAISLNVTLAAIYHNSPVTLTHNAERYIIYLGACLPIIIMAREGVPKSSILLKYVVIIGSVSYAIAAILNSTYRLPSDLIEPLGDKYFVGPFLRAGAGYLDPNFLAINLIVLLVVSSHFTMGTASRLIVASACLIGIFLTFSRAAWLVAAVLIASTLINNRKSIYLIGLVFVIGEIGRAHV